MVKLLIKNAHALVINDIRTILLFLLTGLCNTAIYFLTFALFWSILNLNHVIAVTFAYIIAATIYFFTNRNLAFKAKNGLIIVQAIKFIMCLTANYFITLIIVEYALQQGLSPYLGLLFAAAVTAITGYIAFKYYVFRTQES